VTGVQTCALPICKGIDIADPNYPGDTGRRIEYEGGAFKPYNSGANADDIAAGKGRAYESIGYMAKTAMVDWALLSKRWDELKDGTIGNDRFPAYQVKVVDDQGNEKPMVDGYVSRSDRIGLVVDGGDVPIGVRVLINGAVVRRDGDGKYPLSNGENLIGIDIWGDVNADPQNRRWEYIDFKYFKVTYGDRPCRGWVLDSVEVERYDAWEFSNGRSEHVFAASEEGWFSGSGKIRSPLGGGDPAAFFSVYGTWFGLPECINPGEPVQVTLTLDASLETTDKERWGSVGAYIYLMYGRELAPAGSIDRELYATAPPISESVVAQFTLDADRHGEYPESVPIRVECRTDSGTAMYVYNYVWQG
jgi:hypothetical protein